MKAPLTAIRILTLGVLTAAAASSVSCDKTYTRNLAEGEYRSVIRLWEPHHMNDTVKNQLLDAFRKYPGSVDEVWFCPEDKWPCNFKQMEENARKMAEAAAQVRELGIIASIQDISLGHPDWEICTGEKNNLGYRPAVGNDGAAAANQTCPRDTAFQNDYARRYAIYCAAIQPDNVMIDDDLRITQHFPAEQICFCDECISQFNAQYGHSFTRSTLWAALEGNMPGLRKEWVEFSQESLAQFARRIAEEVHKVAPDAHMGLQHPAFHKMKLEGSDWNKTFKAMQEATGNSIASRPGHGVYYDHAPRDIIGKSYGISRQIARLDADCHIIFPEIEGYYHKATGKSPQGLATETMLHLSMGADAMSYSINASVSEPMEWYAENYFKVLDRYHPLYCDYVSHNHGTEGAGIDDYISPSILEMDGPGWKTSNSGSTCHLLSALGIPFTPEQKLCTAAIIDAPSIQAMSRDEFDSQLARIGTVTDANGWKMIVGRGFEDELTPVATPGGLGGAKCFRSKGGRNVAVIPGAFKYELSTAERAVLMRTFDWASEGRMSVIVETMAQCYTVPRALASDGSLRSVVYCNATISDQEDITLRLRGCPSGAKISWESVNGSKRLKAVHDGNDVLVTIPFIKAWDAGWIKIK